MIVYEATKLEFIEDTRNNLIVSKIECEYRKKVRSSINEREETAWRNSMQFMKNILEDECKSILQNFFKELREKKKSNRGVDIEN